MNIIEIKNNLVKLSYVEDVTLSSFVKISDVVKSYIAQVIHIEATRIGKIAYARLIFNFQTTIKAYDGSIPSIQSEVEPLEDDFFVKYLDKNDGIWVGKTAVGEADVVISSTFLKDKPIICAEKTYQSNTLIENILKQNEIKQRKTVVIDLSGEIKGNKITATKDFKFPLNKDSIDDIFDNGFEDLTPENQAFIEDIFSELKAYIKTIEYIPFKDFNAVIDYEFKRTQKLQLIILKNRLSQFNLNGIFAQDKSDFVILDEKLEKDNTLVIDLSLLNAKYQQEYISYIYKRMTEKNNNFYSIVQLDNNNTSETLLHTIMGAKNVFTSYVCPYAYKYLSELKQCSKNMFMFTPIRQGHDFGAYNVFLNRLAEDEFILYGKTTKFIPLIIKMGVRVNEVNGSPVVIEEPTSEVISVEVETPTMEVAEGGVEVDEPKAEVVEVAVEEPVTEIVEPKVEEPVTEIVEPKVEAPAVEVDIAPAIVEEIGERQDEVDDDIDDDILDEIEIEEVELDLGEEEEGEEEEINEFPTVAVSTQESEEDNEILDELSDEDLDLIEELGGVGVNDVDVEIEEPTSDVVPVEIDEPTTDVTEVDVEIEESTSDVVPVEIDEPVAEVIKPQQSTPKSITDEILQEEAEKQIAQDNLPKVNPIEKHIEAPTKSGLETKQVNTPDVPVYSAEIPDEDLVESDPVQQGDVVEHPEFGRGVVEKIINYGDRTLCSVNFDQIGRRLLDPKVSELKKQN